MQASDEPIAEVPIVFSGSGAFQRMVESKKPKEEEAKEAKKREDKELKEAKKREDKELKDAKKDKEAKKKEDKEAKEAKKKEAKKKVVVIDEEEEEEEEEEDCTVMMAPSVSPAQKQRPDVFLVNAQLNVERVEINGVCFLICENGIAYLESSKKMVGVYDEKDSSIRQMYGVEYDEYYGSSDVDSDEDELPV